MHQTIKTQKNNENCEKRVLLHTYIRTNSNNINKHTNNHYHITEEDDVDDDNTNKLSLYTIIIVTNANNEAPLIKQTRTVTSSERTKTMYTTN